MVQGSMSCIKYLMFVFNFVFVVCGIILIVVGGIVQGAKNFTVFANNQYVTAPTILIVVGVVIFVLAFLGCCGAIKENHCMVTMFGVLLLIIFVVEIAGGVTAYVYRGQFDSFLQENMNETIAQDKKDAKKLWDEMQTNWKCCGVHNFTDYIYNGKPVPDSCCDPPHEANATCTKPYTTGCYDQLLVEMKGEIAKVGGAAIGIGVVELIGVMFAFCLAGAIKKEYEGV